MTQRQIKRKIKELKDERDKLLSALENINIVLSYYKSLRNTDGKECVEHDLSYCSGANDSTNNDC